MGTKWKHVAQLLTRMPPFPRRLTEKLDLTTKMNTWEPKIGLDAARERPEYQSKQVHAFVKNS